MLEVSKSLNVPMKQYFLRNITFYYLWPFRHWGHWEHGPLPPYALATESVGAYTVRTALSQTPPPVYLPCLIATECMLICRCIRYRMKLAATILLLLLPAAVDGVSQKC